MASYRAVSATVEDGAICVRFECDVQGAIGWQLFDPATGAFLSEGEWSESGAATSVRVALPPEGGAYRVQVAPVEDREQYIAIDAEVGAGDLAISEPRVVDAYNERFFRRLVAIRKAFTSPTACVWRNRKLILSMVKRDIMTRYRGSFAGALWTLLTPLLLMATYFFVFGVVLRTRFSADNSGVGYVLYFLAGMLPWLPFQEAVGR